MPATGARRGHLVYHWKHGWIPLDHMAALSKSKGSHKGAEKIMQKHGIGGHAELMDAASRGSTTPHERAFSAYWDNPTHESRAAAVAAYADLPDDQLTAEFAKASKARAEAVRARDVAVKVHGRGTPEVRAINEDVQRHRELEAVIHAASNLQGIRKRQRS